MKTLDTGLCVTPGGGIVALPWESEFFGRTIGLLSCVPLGAEPQPEDLAGFDIVQAKVQASQLEIADGLSRLGFRLAETEVRYSYEVRPSGKTIDHAVAGPEHLSAVEDLARRVFRFSRFRPPWFLQEDAGRYYATWAAKAVAGTFDDECLIIEADQGLLGFVTVKAVGDGTGRIGLLASGAKDPGRGVGATLVEVALAWCADRGIERMEVATQLSNANAMRLYERTGGLVDSVAYWMYWSADAR